MKYIERCIASGFDSLMMVRLFTCILSMRHIWFQAQFHLLMLQRITILLMELQVCDEENYLDNSAWDHIYYETEGGKESDIFQSPEKS